ncbi:hypothetical protein [Vreelandella lionensis]|uniref:hypothetical protein n=1 Tax=Vreelandella lionensis TaxID=1144478 RepID=UPI0009F401CE|nr:hypothetical protein [Halomonas lionensis]
MGKTKRVSYALATEFIHKEKTWVGPKTFAKGWVGSDSTPSTFKIRAPLEVEGMIIEGCFAEVLYKRSPSGLARDTFSASFFVDNARIVGIDDGKPSTHTNRVGADLDHYGQIIPHPHLHLPIESASYGYAIPLVPMSTPALWQLFLNEAGIRSAPDFTMPPEEQGSLLP